MSNPLELGLDFVKDLFLDKIRKALGLGDEKLDLADNVKAELERRAKALAADMTNRLEDEARQMIYVFGLAFAFRDLGDAAAKVPEAFVPDGSVPDLGLDVTVVGPDEKLEGATIDAVDEKFDKGEDK